LFQLEEMMSDQTTYQRLAAPFELADHAKVPKGGMTQTYAPWTAYVQRLNEVLPNQWSFRVIREGFTETECWVLGEVTAVIDGETVTRQQYGCEPILKGGKPASDLLKTAASDAVKKASQLIGPGLYLSIKEEREAIDAAIRDEAMRLAAEMAEARRAGQNAPKAPPAHAATNAASPGTTASPAASTPPASGATPTSSSTTATDVQKAALRTGATPINQQTRWQRLVAEAERAKLPTLGQVKAIDPKAISEAQLKSYGDLLETRLYEHRETGAA
jgi:hypothetical protein